jgi:hypothetical protein
LINLANNKVVSLGLGFRAPRACFFRTSLQKNPNTISYTTKEFKTPTAKTKKNHNPRPEKILPLFCVQPSGEAKATGTPTTNKNETPINAKRVN